MLLEKIRDSLGVGIIYNYESSNETIYQVNNIKDLQIIIDHFTKYPLVSHKKTDFEIFKQCFEKIKKGEHLNKEGLEKILSLKKGITVRKINNVTNNHNSDKAPKILI